MAGFWIYLVKVSKGFEYASSSKCQGLEYGKVVNMWGLHKVLHVPEKLEYAIKIPHYVWIHLNNAE